MIANSILRPDQTTVKDPPSLPKVAAIHRVLLVDDEPALLSSLRRVVERAANGAVVVYASDAETAIWQLESTAIRLVLTDLRMQNEDEAGWKVVEAARRVGVQAVIVTGHFAEEEVIDRARSLDVPIIRKTDLSTREILALVERAFSPQ
jgi:DNA-binding NtrC family response regulator